MPKFKCILQRLNEFDNVMKPNKPKAEGSTIGRFKVYNDETKENVFSCYCVENAGPSTDTPKQDKRIVAREYKLYWTESSVTLPKEFKPKCISLYTDELPSFKDRRIHIHIGNYPQDTEGCLLLCHSWNGKVGYANQSTQAIHDFYSLVTKEGIDNFTLLVREINNG